MNKLILSLILMLSCGLVNAQVDVLPNTTDDQSVVVLNDNLQRLDARNRTLQDQLNAVLPIDLSLYGTSVDNQLGILGGGTGASTAQGAIDNITIPTSGVAGQVWTTNGTNGSWGTIASSISLVSTTNLSGVTTTGNIAIDATKKYMIVFAFADDGFNSACNPVFQFNATANNYEYHLEMTYYDGTTAVNTINASGASAPFDSGNSMHEYDGIMYLTPRRYSSNTMFIKADYQGSLATSRAADMRMNCLWRGASAPTSFVITFSNNTSGYLKLYEIQ